MPLVNERIRLARLAAGLTQDDLSRATGRPKASIGNWETKHEPPASAIAEIAKACHVTADYLVGLSDDPAARPIRPGDWVIDTDRIARVTAGKVPILGMEYAWPVPSRFDVKDAVSFREWEIAMRGAKPKS